MRISAIYRRPTIYYINNNIPDKRFCPVQYYINNYNNNNIHIERCIHIRVLYEILLVITVYIIDDQ